jgi:hypothetical protein
MKKNIALVLLITFAFSCNKNPEYPTDSMSSILAGNGVFICNEGNFRGGNGSLSFYSYDSAKIYNDIFMTITGRPLGDVPNSMVISGDKGYIVVNNSGKIEVVKRNTLESITTINGLVSPRNMAIINSNKAYVSSIYSDSVTILNLSDNSITGYINLKHSSESIVVSGNKAFISDWIGGNEILVVNTINNSVVDSIEVGPEPESMVIDKYNMLWVLCNGGWTRQNFAELVVINTVTNLVERKYVFPTKQASPSCLQIGSTGETLYYLDNGVMQMNIGSDGLPSTPLISEAGGYFYKIGVNPVNSDIFITDAVDYTQQGFVLYYKKDGTFVSKNRSDIIPGLMCFKLNYNYQVK